MSGWNQLIINNLTGSLVTSYRWHIIRRNPSQLGIFHRHDIILCLFLFTTLHWELNQGKNCKELAVPEDGGLYKSSPFTVCQNCEVIPWTKWRTLNLYLPQEPDWILKKTMNSLHVLPLGQILLIWVKRDVYLCSLLYFCRQIGGRPWKYSENAEYGNGCWKYDHRVMRLPLFLTDKHKTDAQCIVPICAKLLSQRDVKEDPSHRLPGVMMLYRCKVTGFCQNNKRNTDDLDIMLHT